MVSNVFILSPYLSSDDRKVLLSFSKVFRFNATVRAQNIFVIALLPLGIFAIILLCSSIYVIRVLVMEMITSNIVFISYGATFLQQCYDERTPWRQEHISAWSTEKIVLNTIGLSCATIEALHRHDSSTTIELFHCMEDSFVAVFKGVIAADGGLVHAGDFVELLCSETKYALFLTSCQLETGESFCVLQGCDEFVVNSEPVLNEYECPLLAITKSIFSADCSQIKQAVSIVHECSDSCTFDWGVQL
eukprot:Em0007g475a